MAMTASFRVHPHPHPGHDWGARAATSEGRHWQPASHPTLALIRETWRRWRSRQHLTVLNDHMLRDIGVTRAEAEHELNKPFWRA